MSENETGLWMARDADGFCSLHAEKPLHQPQSIWTWESEGRSQLSEAATMALIGVSLAPGTCRRLTGKLTVVEPEPEPQACPVCGGRSKVIGLGGMFYAHCRNGLGSRTQCCITGPFRPTAAEAITAWNRLSYK